ncbi:MAG: Hpt domain-containing protein, partial [Pirellulales bacterium]|nr:Hpt domain-containing protein [Pirellulales bacterium]
MSETEAVARDDFFECLLGDFLDESGQLLDRLNDNLLQLDEWVRSLGDGHRSRCDDELMNDMFRSAHSLKGLSAMLGLKDINTLTHKVENVFDAARKDELVITGDVVELIFQAVDRLGGLVEGLKDTGAEPVECESVVAGIA